MKIAIVNSYNSYYSILLFFSTCRRTHHKKEGELKLIKWNQHIGLVKKEGASFLRGRLCERNQCFNALYHATGSVCNCCRALVWKYALK